MLRLCLSLCADHCWQPTRRRSSSVAPSWSVSPSQPLQSVLMGLRSLQPFASRCSWSGPVFGQNQRLPSKWVHLADRCCAYCCCTLYVTATAAPCMSQLLLHLACRCYCCTARVAATSCVLLMLLLLRPAYCCTIYDSSCCLSWSNSDYSGRHSCRTSRRRSQPPLRLVPGRSSMPSACRQC